MVPLCRLILDKSYLNKFEGKNQFVQSTLRGTCSCRDSADTAATFYRGWSTTSRAFSLVRAWTFCQSKIRARDRLVKFPFLILIYSFNKHQGLSRNSYFSQTCKQKLSLFTFCLASKGRPTQLLLASLTKIRVPTQTLVKMTNLNCGTVAKTVGSVVNVASAPTSLRVPVPRSGSSRLSMKRLISLV